MKQNRNRAAKPRARAAPQALFLLDEAVAAEEGLGYMEPPRLHQPVRQCLGWVLLRAGKASEAAEVYRKVSRRRLHDGGLAAVRRGRGLQSSGRFE
jgi:hypothetical protein